MSCRRILVVMALGAIGFSSACGSESATPADSRAGDSGAGTGGNAGTGAAGGSGAAGRGGRVGDASAPDGRGGNAGSSGSAEDARGNDAPPDSATECGICRPGMRGVQDKGCVDRQSGEREVCDANSTIVDFGERCYGGTGCTIETAGPEPHSGCPPCAPFCTVYYVGAFCDGQLVTCAPPGFRGPGCNNGQ